jgi:ankyrin repeat protein
MKKMIFILIIGVVAQFLSGAEIHELVKAGNLDNVKIYLEQHPDQFDVADDRNSTPLHFACDRGFIELVKYLVELGADINKQDVDGDTPLIWTITRNYYSIAEFLIGKGVDVNVLNNGHINALFWTIYRSDAAMAKLLIDNGIDISIQNYEGNTALHIAGINQKVEIAKLLIDKGADLEVRESRGRTPLVLTAREHGNYEIIKYMIENGADINSVDNYGATALELTAWRGYEEVLDYLLDNGVQIPIDEEKRFLIADFCCENSLEKLYWKLDDIGIFDQILKEKRKNFLLSAAQGESIEMVSWLTEKGFNVNEQDYYGWTPLHYAAETGNLEILQTLIDKGANTNSRNLMGESAFNIAESKSNQEVCDYLNSINADAIAVKLPVLKGKFMGQSLPKSTLEIFAKGIVSSKHFHHSPVAFSPAGDLAVWPNDKPIPGTGYTESDLYYSRYINDIWTYPQPMPFTTHIEEGEPFFSSDGKRLYFLSRRTRPEGGERTKENIWYVEVYEDDFSDPVIFDDTINSNEMHWQFSIDSRNNVYIGSSQSGGYGQNDIYLFRYVEGSYKPVENIGEVINTAAAEFNPIISIAGDFLIFTRMGSDVNGLFISKKQSDETWSKPHSMNDIVFENAMCSLLSPDEKYLFFLGRENENQGIFWVDVEDYIKNVK